MGFEKIYNLTKVEYNKEVKKRQVLSAERTNEMKIDRTDILIKARAEYKNKSFIINCDKVEKAKKELIDNGEKVNISKLSRMTGLDRKTVKKYFDILNVE